MSTCNCKFGTLMELACVGKADEHFIGSPSHSMFRQQYHQHGNFAVDWCVKDPFRGNGLTRKATISKEGDLLIGGMIVLKYEGNDSEFNSFPEGILEFAPNLRTCQLLIGNQCIQTIDVVKITEVHRAYNSLPLQNKMAGGHVKTEDNMYQPKNIYGAEFFFVKEKTPMWLHTNQTIQVRLLLEFDKFEEHGLEYFNKHMTAHFHSFQVYLPQNERTPPSMQHLPIRVEQTMEYHIGDIQPNHPLRLTLPFNLPIYKLHHGLFAQFYEDPANHDNETVRVYINNNLRFEGTRNEIEAIASVFYEENDAILFGIPSEDGFGGAFNMSRADTVEVEFEFNMNLSDRKKEERKEELNDPRPDLTRKITAFSYNILQYHNGTYSLLYSD